MAELSIGDGVPLEDRPEVRVLVPLWDADREVDQLVGRDVDAAMVSRQRVLGA